MNRFLRFIFSRKIITILLMLIQAAALLFALIFLQSKFAVVYVTLIALSFIIVYYIINKNFNPAFKLAWVIPILLFPIFGGLVYVFFQAQLGIRMFKKALAQKVEQTEGMLKQNADILNEMDNDNKHIGNLARYLHNYAGFPVHKNTSVTYFSSGEKEFPAILKELKNAEHFIFLEYFIIADGKMWNDILTILKQKAADGIDVRVIYDGIGSEMILPDDYEKVLQKYGIKCHIFNKLRPFLSTAQNNRDHRKIIVIDGHTAFSGGVNIGDEYINEVKRFGYWKDTAVMLKGEAVWNFTMMFLQMWELMNDCNDDYLSYAPYLHYDGKFESDGFVIPYGDSPIDNEPVGKHVYLDIINKARDYVYITSPYLVLDNEMFTALTYAAKSNVDVKIIVPNIQDKWYMAIIAQSYFKDLMMAGVKIYKFTPGFIHAKNFVSDDTIAVCGSINLDYRSLYMHYECATLMYKSSAVKCIKEDFINTLEKCHQVTIEDVDNIKLPIRIITGALRLISPLL
jgi:cardiolipin synthase